MEFLWATQVPFVPFQTMALFLYDLKCVRDAFRLFLTDGNSAGSKLPTFYLLSDYPCMSSTSSYFLCVPVKKNFPQIPRLQTVAMAPASVPSSVLTFSFPIKMEEKWTTFFLFCWIFGLRDGLVQEWTCPGVGLCWASAGRGAMFFTSSRTLCIYSYLGEQCVCSGDMTPGPTPPQSNLLCPQPTGDSMLAMLPAFICVTIPSVSTRDKPLVY